MLSLCVSTGSGVTVLRLFQRARLSSTIFELGGSIESVGSYYGESAGERGLVVKVRDVSRDQLVDPLEALGDHVVDARDV